MRYVVGLDVGSHSLGYAAVEVDEEGAPLRILAAGVHVHDGGIDPSGRKQSLTRQSVSGVARRTRRRLRRRRERLTALDSWITEQGWPVRDLPDQQTYAAWAARARLAFEWVEDEGERAALLSVAVRHIARHRGWRNPYASVESLLVDQPESEQLVAFKQRARERGASFPDNATFAQVVMALDPSSQITLRGDSGILEGKFMQTDVVRELRRIAEVQGLDTPTLVGLVRHVFAAESPKGSGDRLAGKDPLPGRGHLKRAPKASPAFQRHRIAATVANLRVVEGGRERPLSPAEIRSVVTMLEEFDHRADPLWEDVANTLGVTRRALRGTAGLTADGERSVRPPVDVTDRVMRACKVEPVSQWWRDADRKHREILVSILQTGRVADDLEESDGVDELLASLDEDQQVALEALTLPPGRAAYSRQSLQEITEKVLADGEDLHSARRDLFDLPEDWTPPAEAVNEPTGNPAVDRVLRLVGRVLGMMHAEWGPPQSVNIEHVRAAFVSDATAEQLHRGNQRRRARNAMVVAEMLGVGPESVRPDQVTRCLAVQRQNGQCLYCGGPITYGTAEMDHIVPRSGPATTNRRENLAAVCERCNKSKGNTPFARWADSSGIDGVSVEGAVNRVKAWMKDPALQQAGWRRFIREVAARLQRTEEDPPLDERSMESVAWMANELAFRIRSAATVQSVNVYRGALTSEARKASGVDRQVAYLDGAVGKSRIDRRHHAVDAAVIALMRPSVAKTLGERIELRIASRLAGGSDDWKAHRGAAVADRVLFERWAGHMTAVVDMLNVALQEDRVPVMGALRLRLGNSLAHAETVNSFAHKGQLKRVGDAWSEGEIDRVETPAAWCALTRHPDFVVGEGLPVDPLNRPGFLRGSQGPCRRAPSRGGADGRCSPSRLVGPCRSRRGVAGG